MTENHAKAMTSGGRERPISVYRCGLLEGNLR